MIIEASLRDNLLITAGSRAAYMDVFHVINLPYGVDVEDEAANFIVEVVDEYIEKNIDESFDIFIEERLIARFKEEE